jgi:quercetin dioxygenase-like cupin family protein
VAAFATLKSKNYHNCFVITNQLHVAINGFKNGNACPEIILSRSPAHKIFFCKFSKTMIAWKHIKDLPVKQLTTGITGYYAHGNSMTLGYVEIVEGSDLAEHHHVHEQITFILEGQLDMVIGGKAYSLTAGMYHVIPSNTPHSAFAKTACKVIDVFNPVREDYKS